MKVTIENAKHLRSMFRLAPVVSSIVLIMSIVLLLKGYEVEIIRKVFSQSTLGTIVMIYCSYYMHFCCTHRLFLLYNEVVGDCMMIQDKIGFGDYRTMARFIVLCVGILLILKLILNFNTFCKDGK